MQHLSLESLAELVDHEQADAEQARHLEQCAACRAELEALRAQGAALAALPPLEAPLGAWAALEERLADEGLITYHAPAAETPRPWWTRAPLRAAAAFVLFAAGGMSGAALVQARSGASPAGTATTAPGGESRVEWAATGDSRTADEAAARLRSAESAYLAALARYQEVTGSSRSADPIARLAALEGIVLTTRAALDEAPADPVINGYHLAALGQRDAILRQIARDGEVDEIWF